MENPNGPTPYRTSLTAANTEKVAAYSRYLHCSILKGGEKDVKSIIHRAGSHQLTIVRPKLLPRDDGFVLADGRDEYRPTTAIFHRRYKLVGIFNLFAELLIHLNQVGATVSGKNGQRHPAGRVVKVGTRLGGAGIY